MIRVNLLPVRKARRRSRGLIQLLLFFGVVVFQIVLLGATYFYFAIDRDDLRSQVAEKEERVEELEGQTEEISQFQDELEEYEEQQEVLERLQARRIGPVQMLDELQKMLSPPIDEEARHAQLRKDWDVDGWQPRRVWLESFHEDEDQFRLDGYAADADDVAQFLLRMTTAVHFDNVELDHIERHGDEDGEYVSFHMYGDYDYSGFDRGEQDS